MQKGIPPTSLRPTYTYIGVEDGEGVYGDSLSCQDRSGNGAKAFASQVDPGTQ